MPNFIYPLLSLVLDFLCLLLCIRFIFSKKGGVWIAPVFLTLIFLAGSALCLLAQVSTNVDATTRQFSKALSYFFLGASFIWIIGIIVFRVALNPNSLQEAKDKQNLSEALFIKQKTAPNIFWKSGDTTEEFLKTGHKRKSKQNTKTQVYDSSQSYGSTQNSAKKTSQNNSLEDNSFEDFTPVRTVKPRTKHEV